MKVLADRVGGADPGFDRARLVEQLRYWTRLDLLTPEGPKHGGSGRWRTYAPTAVFVAAVLHELSQYRVSVPVMHTVAATLRLGLEGPAAAEEAEESGPVPVRVYAQRLLEALQGTRDVFLAVYAEGPGAAGVDLSYHPLDAEGPAGAARSAVVVNLTRVFAAVR